MKKSCFFGGWCCEWTSEHAKEKSKEFLVGRVTKNSAYIWRQWAVPLTVAWNWKVVGDKIGNEGCVQIVKG